MEPGHVHRLYSSQYLKEATDEARVIYFSKLSLLVPGCPGFSPRGSMVNRGQTPK